MSSRRHHLRCSLCGCAWNLTHAELVERGWRCLDRAGLFDDDDALCNGLLISRGEYRALEQRNRDAAGGAE
jgi:hypothetical protein